MAPAPPGRAGSWATATRRPARASVGGGACVLDVATRQPLGMGSILAAVRDRGRVGVVHEAAISGGYGAEIAARIASEGLFELCAPIERVAGYDTVMPLSQLEHLYMPDAGRIVEAARRALTCE